MACLLALLWAQANIILFVRRRDSIIANENITIVNGAPTIGTIGVLCGQCWSNINAPANNVACNFLRRARGGLGALDLID